MVWFIHHTVNHDVTDWAQSSQTPAMLWKKMCFWSEGSSRWSDIADSKTWLFLSWMLSANLTVETSYSFKIISSFTAYAVFVWFTFYIWECSAYEMTERVIRGKPFIRHVRLLAWTPANFKGSFESRLLNLSQKDESHAYKWDPYIYIYL